MEEPQKEDEVPKPDDPRKDIYAMATEHLGKLILDPKEAEAKLKVEALNIKIKEMNLRDKLPKEDLDNFLIPISTFLTHFDFGRKYYYALQKDPKDDDAREKLTNINLTLRQLNEWHDYPPGWVFSLANRDPDKPELSGAVISKPAEKSGQPSTKRGVKTKVGVLIRDESDGRTSLGKVQYVRKAGFGTRVIVNRGTEEHLYFEIYPGAEFGKGIAKEWEKEGKYECKDLPKNIEAGDIEVYGRVKVKRSGGRRNNKTSRTQSQIQYYLVRVRGREYVCTRTALSGVKKLSPSLLRRDDAKLDTQNEQLLAELDECRKNNEHPDTGEQLTKAELEEMPWLSPDTIRQMSNDEEEEEEDDDDENEYPNMVRTRKGLKRSVKPTAVPGISETS